MERLRKRTNKMREDRKMMIFPIGRSVSLTRCMLALGVVGFAHVAYAQDVIYSLDEFHVTEGGSFGGKLLSNMSTSQFRTIVIAACAYWGVDCSTEAEAARKGAGVVHDMISGGDYSISGHIDKQAGEEWWVMFFAPAGYSVCKAANNNGAMSITGESTFNAGMSRESPVHNGLGVYAVIPKNRPTRQWVDAYFSVMYVPAGTEAAHGCWPTGSSAWRCKGQNCTYMPGAQL
jgi:hypothetical protein